MVRSSYDNQLIYTGNILAYIAGAGSTQVTPGALSRFGPTIAFMMDLVQAYTLGAKDRRWCK